MPDELEWFPFYVHRFMGSRKVQRMRADMVGGYLLLLIDQWRNGPIPTEEAAFLSRLDDAAAMRLLCDCFTETSDGWVNAALEEIREEQESKARVRSRAGKAGAKARWAQGQNGKRIRTQSDRNATPIALEEKRREEITTSGFARDVDNSTRGVSYDRAADILDAPDSPPSNTYTTSELVDLANRTLGMGILDAKDRNTNRRLVVEWEAGMGRDLAEIAAAIEGLHAMVRDRRPEVADWLPPNKPVTLKALHNTNTLYDQGDGKAQRPLWDVAVEYHRSATPRTTSTRGGGPQRISAVLPKDAA